MTDPFYIANATAVVGGGLVSMLATVLAVAIGPITVGTVLYSQLAAWWLSASLTKIRRVSGFVTILLYIVEILVFSGFLIMSAIPHNPLPNL